MSAIARTAWIGRALAAGALLGLVGCHQIPSHFDTAAVRGWRKEPGGDGRSITPAQEADVQIAMGRVAEKQGDLEQAMVAYRAALTRDGRRADAYLRLAVLHDQQGKFRESAELYRKALARRPGDPDIFCDMGYSFYLQRRWAESESNLRQAIAVKPDHQRAHNNLALLLVRDNRKEDALAEFRKGGSSPAQAHMNLAFALTMDERWESARAEYERALALDPSLQLAKDRLGQLNALLAKLERPRDGAPDDSRLLTTSVNAPPPSRRDVPSAGTTTAATTRPPETARPQIMRDPDLVTTAVTVPAPRRRTRIRLLAPFLRVEDDALRGLGSKVNSRAGASSLGRSDAPVGEATAPPAQSDPRPHSHAARSKDSTGPILALDAPKPTPSGSDSRKRATIPPPRPYEEMAAVRPHSIQSIRSSFAPPPVWIPPPFKHTQTDSDTDTPQAPPTSSGEAARSR